MNPDPKRRRPYTQNQLDSMKCHCCPNPARFQWNACADGNVWRPLCAECDVAINVAVLKILDPKGWKVKVRKYCRSIRHPIPKEAMK